MFYMFMHRFSYCGSCKFSIELVVSYSSDKRNGFALTVYTSFLQL